MTDEIRPELIRLDTDLGADKHEVIRSLAGLVADACAGADRDQIAADAMAREQAGPTGLPNGLAIPHCRSTGATESVVGFARLARRVDFGAKDGVPADLVIFLVHPKDQPDAHLQMLSRLTRSLIKPMFIDGLRDARSTDEAAGLLRRAVDPRAGR